MASNDNELLPAEQAVVDQFTHQLGLALRHITGVEAAASTVTLPQARPAETTTPLVPSTPMRRKSKSKEQQNDTHNVSTGGASDA